MRLDYHILLNHPSPNLTGWIRPWTKHVANVFYKFQICFFLSVLKRTKHTAHMCGIKTLKHNLKTTWQLAYNGCKNLTHTSKPHQVKRTQMVANARIAVRVFVIFFWLLRIELNETVARNVVRFKPEPSPENLQWGALYLRRGTWRSENVIKSPLIDN